MVTERVIRAAPPKPASSGLLQATPFQYYVAGEDTLALSVWSSTVSTVRVAGRWYHSDTGIEPFVYTFTTNGLPSFPQTFAITPQEGYLLNCAVDVINTVVYPGQCFAQLLIGRGHGSTFIKLGTVLQGYVATSKFLAFPGSPLESSLDGAGFLNTVSITQPGAGLEFTHSNQGNRRWRVQWLYFLLATSAVAVARGVSVVFSSNGITPEVRMAAAAAHPASVTRAYTWAAGLTPSADTTAGVLEHGLPDPCLIDAPIRIVSSTNGLDAGDQFSGLRLSYEEHLLTDTIPPQAL